MRYFYTDALIAAYMAREFKLRFVTKNNAAAKSDGKDMYIASDKAGVFNPQGLGGDEDAEQPPITWWQDKAANVKSHFYINPVSLYKLEAQVGDIGLDKDNYPFYYSNYFEVDDFYWHDSEGISGVDIKIIQRNGKAFFTPEQEAE